MPSFVIKGSWPSTQFVRTINGERFVFSKDIEEAVEVSAKSVEAEVKAGVLYELDPAKKERKQKRTIAKTAEASVEEAVLAKPSANTKPSTPKRHGR